MSQYSVLSCFLVLSLLTALDNQGAGWRRLRVACSSVRTRSITWRDCGEDRLHEAASCRTAAWRASRECSNGLSARYGGRDKLWPRTDSECSEREGSERQFAAGAKAIVPAAL